MLILKTCKDDEKNMIWLRKLCYENKTKRKEKRKKYIIFQRFSKYNQLISIKF